jgi:hypothetical protein
MLTLMLTLTPSLGRLTSARDTAVHASPRSRTSRAFLLAGGTGRNARRLTKNLTYLLVYLPTLPPSRNQRRHVSSSPAVTLGRRGASCSSGSITAAPSMRSCKMHSACAAGRQAGSYGTAHREERGKPRRQEGVSGILLVSEGWDRGLMTESLTAWLVLLFLAEKKRGG